MLFDILKFLIIIDNCMKNLYILMHRISLLCITFFPFQNQSFTLNLHRKYPPPLSLPCYPHPFPSLDPPLLFLILQGQLSELFLAVFLVAVELGQVFLHVLGVALVKFLDLQPMTLSYLILYCLGLLVNFCYLLGNLQ